VCPARRPSAPILAGRDGSRARALGLGCRAPGQCARWFELQRRALDPPPDEDVCRLAGACAGDAHYDGLGVVQAAQDDDYQSTLLAAADFRLAQRISCPWKVV